MCNFGGVEVTMLDFKAFHFSPRWFESHCEQKYFLPAIQNRTALNAYFSLHVCSFLFKNHFYNCYSVPNTFFVNNR